MIVYIVVLLVCIFIAGPAEAGWRRRGGGPLPRATSWGAVLVAFILIAVSALRWEVGTDYPTYHYLFPKFASEVPHDLTFFGEPGIRVIAWSAAMLGGGSEIMFALAALITIGLTVRTLWRWSPAFSFSIAIYIVYAGWTGSFNAVRQYLAVAILFVAHRYIVRRELFKWLAVVSIATLFHVSAVVAILFYLVPTKKTNLKHQMLILIAGIIAMFSMGFILEMLVNLTGDVGQWQGSYTSRSINPLRVLFAFLPVFVFWIFNSKKKVNDSDAWFYINMLLIYGVTYLASISSAMVARFAIYPLPFVMIGLAYATAVEDRRERFFLRSVLIIIYAVFFYFDVSKTEDLSQFSWIFEQV